MGVRSRLASGFTSLAKVFGNAEPAAMRQGEIASQMTPATPFSPGEPIGPYDGFSRNPRTREFVPGYNIAARPRSHERVSFDTLRGLVEAYDVAQMAIWHRIDSIRALDWSLISAKGYGDDVTDVIPIGMTALKKPDRDTPFEGWLASYLYDILAYDAGTLYRMRNRAGRAIGLRCVDGTGVAPLLDYWGNTPQDPAEAYVQYVQGLPWNWLTRSDLIYSPFRRRANSPYGMAPLETILLNANTDLRFQAYFLQRFTEGNVPAAFASAPESWTPNQIEQFQQYWDAFMLGDQAVKSQIKWMPGGAGAGIQWSNEKDFSDHFSMFLMRKTCLDEQTEILTRRGWLQFPKLTETDEVATRSEDGRFEWQKPTDYIAEPYSGDMVEFKSNSLDLLVTPDHRMLLTYFPTKKHPRPKEFIRTAGEIVGKGGYMIPMRSCWEGESPETFVLPGVSYEVPNRGGKSSRTVTKPDLLIPMKTWAAFLGLWLAEGHVGGSSGGKRERGAPYRRGATHKIGISQATHSPYFDEIQELLDALPFRWTRGHHTWICQDKRLHNYLAPLGNSHTKYIPAEMKDLSPDLLEILWAWACKGDGHHYLGKFWQMITGSERLADDWQEVLQKCGRDASVSVRKISRGGVIDGRRIVGTRPTWIVRERTSPLRTAHGKLTPYDGMVYCVSVPNGVIYVRRNGRPAWVGNCAAFHVVPSDLGFTENVNRSSGESQADVQHRVGDLPLIKHVQGVLTSFLQDDLGLPLQFAFDLGEEQADRKEQAEADKIYVEMGAISPSDVREMRYGLPEPDGQPVPRFIYTGRAGPIPLASLNAVAGQIDPSTAAPEPGSHLPQTVFGGAEGVAPVPPIKTVPLAEQIYGPDAVPPAPPPQPVAQFDVDGHLVKDTAPAVTEGVTSETGITSYDLAGHDADEDDAYEELVKREMAAFRRFRSARRRDGKWRDFQFRVVDQSHGRRLNGEARASIAKASGGGSPGPKGRGGDSVKDGWPAWHVDQDLSAAYSGRIRQALGDVLTQRAARRIATAWLNAPTHGQPARSWLEETEPALTEQVSAAFHSVLTPLWTTAWAVGTTSAFAVMQGKKRVNWSQYGSGVAKAQGDAPGPIVDPSLMVYDAQSLQDWLDHYGIDSISSISSTRMDDLASLLETALENGDSVDSLSAEIEDLGVDASTADMIASTEVARATSQASMASYEAAGVGQVRWLTAPGACPLCAANEDVGPIGLGDTFPSGSDSSPAHPRCRCSVVPADSGGVDLPSIEDLKDILGGFE